MYTSYQGTDTVAYYNYTKTPIDMGSVGHCLSFWYFMSAYVGTLNVYIIREYSPTGHDPRVWYRIDDHGYQWRQGQIDVPAEAFPLTAVLLE